MLDVLIAGAGIAGLTAGLALRRAGHRVHIYERSSMNHEVGAAINLPPNAGRFLIAWGLDPIKNRFVKARRIDWSDPQTLEHVASIPHEHNFERYEADLWLAHRVDLHDALKDLATDPNGPGIPVTIHLESFVVGYNTERPSMSLANGKVIRGDLVIGADGLHSIACETVIGRRNPPIQPKHYNYCYRFLIPVEAFEEDPETRWYNEDRDGVTRLFTHNATSRRIVSYTCRDSTVHNFVGIFYDEEVKSITREDYLNVVDSAELLKTFEGFHPKILAVISKATDVKRWPLLYRAPIPSWRRGKMALAGDAAHPMLPHQAQGGAQGIEDGVALGIVFNGATAEQIEERLDLYEKVRRNRASAIQILSNVGADQSHIVHEELRQFLPESEIPTNPVEIFAFNFGHNVETAASTLITESQKVKAHTAVAS
ncbi:FAD binding domain-containing protein [Xylariales sp. PMI_506]|nr:FAD binding domain-containing protein [Xylariales sp. PMI_506]